MNGNGDAELVKRQSLIIEVLRTRVFELEIDLVNSRVELAAGRDVIVSEGPSEGASDAG